MEIKVHDIVEFACIEKLKDYTSLPPWVVNSPEAANYGVVRRMATSKDIVPIGLRGKTREQRAGTFIHKQEILRVITPESLINQMDKHEQQIYYSSLRKIREEFLKLNLTWGPTGSVGFEIATSHKVTSTNSDIDISIYIKEIDHHLLVEVNQFIDKLEFRIDAQVEIPQLGAFLLNDYVKHSESGFILRTPFGPQLCNVQDERIRLKVNV